MTNNNILRAWLVIVVVFAGVTTALEHWDVVYGLRVASVMILWALIMYAIWREPK